MTRIHTNDSGYPYPSTKQPFFVSKFTTENPQHLSKAFRLNEEGTLLKESGGNLIRGTVETIELYSINDFANCLMNLTPANAMSYGICNFKKATVITQNAMRNNGECDFKGKLPFVTRTRECFQYPPGPTIFMIDYDPEKDTPPLAAQELLPQLYGACPGLKDSPHVVTPSASGFIYQGEKQHRGPGGLRIHIIVKDGSDIPRAGDAFFKRLSLNGHGRIAISKAGTMLVRTIIDGAVYQPERLDFCGGAYCASPLEQRRPDPIVFNNDAPPLDTVQALPSLSQNEEQQYQRLVEEAKTKTKPQADIVREDWASRQVEKRLDEYKQIEPSEKTTITQELRRTYTEASKNKRLLGDFNLKTANGDTVTVNQLLENPSKWDGKRFPDPLEPIYRNDNRIAQAFLNNGRPHIYSHAHGGQRYYLHRQRKKIQVSSGERDQVCQTAMDVVRQEGTIYQRGGEMVRVSSGGDINPLGLDALMLSLDRNVLFMKSSGVDKEGKPKPPVTTDCPLPVAKGIMAMKNDGWKLPTLNTAITAPTMIPKTGRIIERYGYDHETGIYLACSALNKWPGIPANPSKSEVKQAFKTLWRAFQDFPFCGPVSRGVFLAILLTALIRATLPTAPGILFSSSTPGSGKTLLALCLAILTGTQMPVLIPATDNAEEVRKRLLAHGRLGAPVMVLDNLSGDFESDALCTWLTSPVFSDRVLGASEMVTIPTNSLVVITGNNVRLGGDICRRVLTCQIDPGMEEPWRRMFALEPAQYCRDHWIEMVAAGLTLLRASFLQEKKPKDRTASFEDWSDCVRPAVLMIGELGLLDVADPVESFSSAFAQDHEQNVLQQLLGSLFEEFGEASITVADIVTRATARNAEGDSGLMSSLIDISGDPERLNAKKIGRWLLKVRRRIVGGLWVDEAGKSRGVKLWRIQNNTRVSTGV